MTNVIDAIDRAMVSTAERENVRALEAIEALERQAEQSITADLDRLAHLPLGHDRDVWLGVLRAHQNRRQALREAWAAVRDARGPVD